jgi:hypothetical protein
VHWPLEQTSALFFFTGRVSFPGPFTCALSGPQEWEWHSEQAQITARWQHQAPGSSFFCFYSRLENINDGYVSRAPTPPSSEPALCQHTGRGPLGREWGEAPGGQCASAVWVPRGGRHWLQEGEQAPVRWQRRRKPHQLRSKQKSCLCSNPVGRAQGDPLILNEENVIFQYS